MPPPFPDRPFIHLLLPAIPTSTTEEIAWTFAYGADAFEQEMRDTCLHLGYMPIVHHIGLNDYIETLATLPAANRIFYLCDGNEADDHICGITPVREMEGQGRRFIGSGSAFWHNTTHKALMKRLFLEAGVPTPRYCSFFRGEQVVIDPSLVYPLFVKPESLYGSVGLSDDSVLLDGIAAAAQIACMLNRFGRVLVEEFIEGREFTVVVLGDGEVFALAERRFDARLAPLQQFISYERSWIELASNYGYHAIEESELTRRLSETAAAAFRGVGGDAYARVDIRQRQTTGDLFVLEVNSMPSVSADSSVAECVRCSGHTLLEMFDRILSQAAI
jgi:D-alanine-D-alanine ligase